ncbi:hypothetical protein THAOC_19732 [Thalassiosira oceanica]|uniref:Uncharacterized protein n=1 Tax=Thalassiosira oceanica TaxID=159749 RepID=K0S3Y7_THAOC|nr:hypothetical protein THAOC_19732 [Thalassiosira oceanica]|eukprot:EJK59990.1 hypothetical protein THAOC_19732 [Thalassiosira oceanica]
MVQTRHRRSGRPPATAASGEDEESDASGDTNVLPSSPASEMSLSDDVSEEDASDLPTKEFLANDLGMMPELADVLHEVKTDQHITRTLRYSVHFKEEKSQKVFFEGGPAVELDCPAVLRQGFLQSSSEGSLLPTQREHCERADGGAASANIARRRPPGKRSSKKTKRRQKKAAKEYESSDEKDVPFCYSEDELDESLQHEDMLDVATE